MNTTLKTLRFRAETTETLCPTHLIPLMEIAGHRLCKSCAKETVHHSHAAYADELQQRLLQQKIKNSGLNKRYLDRGFKNFVVACPAQTMPSNYVRLLHSRLFLVTIRTC